MSTLRQQLRNNTVALISLVVALSSLGYNTWRNERTEYNRNIRTATFELFGENWEGVGRDDEKSVNRIDDAIGGLREAALATVRSLH